MVILLSRLNLIIDFFCSYILQLQINRGDRVKITRGLITTWEDYHTSGLGKDFARIGFGMSLAYLFNDRILARSLHPSSPAYSVPSGRLPSRRRVPRSSHRVTFLTPVYVAWYMPAML